MQELIAATRFRDDFSVIQGSDRILLKSFRWGCKAGVTVVGNVEPSLAPRLYDAWACGREEEAETLQKALLGYVAVITSQGRYPQEIKVILQEQGICGEDHDLALSSHGSGEQDSSAERVGGAWCAGPSDEGRGRLNPPAYR